MEINLIAEVSQVSPPCYVSVKSGTAAPQRRARAYKGAQFARYTKFCMALADADVGDGENRNASTISSSGFWRRFKKSGRCQAAIEGGAYRCHASRMQSFRLDISVVDVPPRPDVYIRSPFAPRRVSSKLGPSFLLCAGRGQMSSDEILCTLHGSL